MANMRKFARMAMAYGNSGNSEMRKGGTQRMNYYDFDDGYENLYPHRKMESRRRGRDGRFIRGAMEDEESEMNVIGFYTGDEINTTHSMDAGRHGKAEMEWHSGDMHHGHGKSDSYVPFDMGVAIKWTKHMRNSDGSSGAHWSFEQVRKAMKERGIRRDEASFFAVINAIYSDYCVVFKDRGIDDVDFYVEMACAWLDDEDAVEDKVGAYYNCVVKH